MTERAHSTNLRVDVLKLLPAYAVDVGLADQDWRTAVSEVLLGRTRFYFRAVKEGRSDAVEVDWQRLAALVCS